MRLESDFPVFVVRIASDKGVNFQVLDPRWWYFMNDFFKVVYPVFLLTVVPISAFIPGDAWQGQRIYFLHQPLVLGWRVFGFTHSPNTPEGSESALFALW